MQWSFPSPSCQFCLALTVDGLELMPGTLINWQWTGFGKGIPLLLSFDRQLTVSVCIKTGIHWSFCQLYCWPSSQSHGKLDETLEGWNWRWKTFRDFFFQGYNSAVFHGTFFQIFGETPRLVCQQNLSTWDLWADFSFLPVFEAHLSEASRLGGKPGKPRRWMTSLFGMYKTHENPWKPMKTWWDKR